MDNTLTSSLRFGDITLTVTTIRNFQQESDDAEKKLSGPKADRQPYYGLVWESARSLATILAEGPCLAGKSFLEVGCGLAVPSMVAAKKGATVFAADFHPDARAFVEQNLRQNGLKNLVSYTQSDWSGLVDLASKVDCVIGTDIMYDRGKADALGDFLGKAFSGGLKEAVIVDAGRPYIGTFKKRCEGHGLTVAESTHEVQAHGKSVKTVVMTVTK